MWPRDWSSDVCSSDLAGTSWEAEGEPMDERTTLALERAGYTQPFEHTARTIHLTELLRWDLVLPMSIQHAELLQRMARQARSEERRVGKERSDRWEAAAKTRQ